MKNYSANNEIEELKIYLKGKKKPLTIIIDNRDQKDDFIHQVMSNELIKIGPIYFLKDNLLYFVFED